MLDHRMRGRIDQLAIQTIVGKRKCGNHTHRIANHKFGHVRPYGFDNTGCFIAQSSGKPGLDDVLPGPVHHLGTIDAQGFDAYL